MAHLSSLFAVFPNSIIYTAMQRGGFGQIRASKQQQPDEEDEDDKAPQNPLAGLFGGAKKAKVWYLLAIQTVGRHTAMACCTVQCSLVHRNMTTQSNM